MISQLSAGLVALNRGVRAHPSWS